MTDLWCSRKHCYERVVLNDTYKTFQFFFEIPVFFRNRRGLNINEYIPYEPQLTRKKIVHPAQNHHDSSNARGNHPHGCPTAVCLTGRQVSVFWEVKFIANSLRYNAQHDNKISATYCHQRGRSFGRLAWCGHFVNSTKRAQQLTAPSAVSHDLPMTLGTTLPSLVRSRAVAQLERCVCPILYEYMHLNVFFPGKNEKLKNRSTVSPPTFF